MIANQAIYRGEEKLIELYPLVIEYKKHFELLRKARSFFHFYAYIKKDTVKTTQGLKFFHIASNRLLKSTLVHWLVNDVDYNKAEKIIIRKKLIYKQSNNPRFVIFRLIQDILDVFIFLIERVITDLNEK